MRSLLTFFVLFAFLDARESPAQDVASSVDPGIAIVGATVMPMDGSPPLRDATVVIYGDRITAVGPRDEVEIGEAEIIDGSGRPLIPRPLGHAP